MRSSLSRASAMRIAGATVMTAAALVAGLPAAAQAGPPDDRDHDRRGGRSVSVTLENDTRDRLTYSSRGSDLDEGEWARSPSSVNAHRSTTFEAKSERRGGVEGTVIYRSRGADVEITFENSGRGRGHYDCEARRLECSVDVEEDGREAELTVTVSPR